MVRAVKKCFAVVLMGEEDWWERAAHVAVVEGLDAPSVTGAG